MNLQKNTNPFVGLRPFESDESLLFFGRQEQTLELLQRLHQHHFVAVVGSSGSGKSSLIRAGLIPSLKAGYLVDDRDRWMITIMKPGQSPLYNLADAILNQLKPGTDISSVTSFFKKIKEEGVDAVLDIIKPLWKKENTNFFLLVDQFEELFRFSMEQKEVAKKDEAIDFVNILLELSRQTDLPIYVVITMRSDFIGDCAQFNGLPEAMNQSQYLVPRLNRVQLKNAIEGPVKLYGGNINAALTSKLLNDVRTVKDELPLLQHALMRIWDHEMNLDKNGELDLKDYESIGGIEKALSNHADEALKGMNDEELNLTKKIFQALTTIDENGRKIRRPAHLKELQEITGAGREQVLAIINKFIEDKRSFLVINKTAEENDAVIDISHESLIRQWNTLSGWVDEEMESAKNYYRLVESEQLYKNRKKDLLAGSELQLALQWYKEFIPVLAWTKRYCEGFEKSIEYLNESEKQRNAEEKKKKAAKRNRLVLIFSSIALIFVALGFYTIREKKLRSAAVAAQLETEVQRQNITKTKEAFRLITLAEQIVSENPTIAFRIAETALKIDADTLIFNAAQKIYEQNSFYKTIIKDTLHDFFSFAVSPDGTKILTGSYDGTARLWNIDGIQLREFKGHAGPIKSAAFSPDGTKILTGSNDKTARLWNINGTQLRKFKRHRGPIMSVAFSPDGTKILTCSDDTTARLWNINGTQLREFKGHTGGITSVAFSPDGTKILTGFYQDTARLWNIDGTLLQNFKGNTLSVAFSPDGTKILTGSYDNTASLWNIDGTLLKDLKGHTLGVVSVAFLSDGRILTGSYDSTIKIWNIPVNEFAGHRNEINLVAYSPDGTKILTGSADFSARLWNLRGETLEVIHDSDQVTSVAFSPDSKKFLIASGETAKLFNIGDSLPKKFPGHTGVIQSVAFSHDGTKILTGSDDKTVRFWNLNDPNDTGKLLCEHLYGIASVAFSPDNTKILTGSRGDTAKLWSLNGKELKVFKHSRIVYCAVFSPDSTKILTGSGDSTAVLWTIDGDSLRTFRHNDVIESVAFSPDGKKILTGSHDQTAKLWSIDGPLLMTFNVPGRVRSVTFSPDGEKIFIGASDGIGRLYRAMTFQEFLKSNEIDALTEQQKKEFGIK